MNIDDNSGNNKDDTLNKVIENLKGYIKLLEKNKYPIKTAILFGSYANGRYNEWSDIDVLLVSDAFEGERFNDKDKIRKITLSYDYNISPHPYNTRDFDSTNLFLKEIISTGIKLI